MFGPICADFDNPCTLKLITEQTFSDPRFEMFGLCEIQSYNLEGQALKFFYSHTQPNPLSLSCVASYTFLIFISSVTNSLWPHKIYLQVMEKVLFKFNKNGGRSSSSTKTIESKIQSIVDSTTTKTTQNTKTVNTLFFLVVVLLVIFFEFFRI